MRSKIFSLISGCFFLTCCISNNKKDFYKFKFYESDMLRMPIYKPFELISSDGYKNWSLNYPDSIKIMGVEDFCIDSISFINKLIIFHSCDSRVRWGAIDLKLNHLYSFSSYRDYINYLKENELKINMDAALTVFNNWERTGNLPWQKEIP